MGRLYWKFFLFFFFAQLTTVLVVSLAIGMVNDKRDREKRLIDGAPPARTMVLAAASTLKLNGIASLKSLLDSWKTEPTPQLYVVNEAGTELLNRPLPKGVNAASLAILSRDIDNRAIKQIKGDDGHTYWLFVEPRHKRPPPTIINGIKIPNNFKYLFPAVPLIVGIFVSFLFAAMLAWYFSKPIKQLRFAFESAASGNLDARVGSLMQSRRDELADLGSAFDVMVSRVGQLIQSQTHLMHQVSHELRSPLARLQIAIGLIKQQSTQVDIAHPISNKITTSLNRIETESVRMDQLVGELLTLSRLESGMTALQKETIDLNDLLQDLVEDANFEGATNHVNVQFSGTTNIKIKAQPDLIQRAVDNVLRNAVKYSPAQSIVMVSATIDAAAKQVVIHVADYGVGVNASELEAIFKPFYRASTKSASSVDGYGLGLAISKQIIEGHGGQISATNNGNAGLLVMIRLPLI